MKTKLFAGLALAAALLIGGPAFGEDHHGGGKGGGGHATHAVAAVHRGGGGHAERHVDVAASHRSTGGRMIAARSNRVYRGTYSAPAKGYATTRTTRNGARASVAFGGTSGANYNNNSHGRYAFASHQGWNHNQEYYWGGHHYRWYGNGWYIIDSFPLFGGYGYYGPGYGAYNGSSVSSQVQYALYQQGYYQGPVDGIVGPGTRGAIAAYQRDNGLPVTGTITVALLSDLGIG